jgi:Ran GTPase-activating protein (RanGAP) involved in mRNA processing and transport
MVPLLTSLRYILSKIIFFSENCSFLDVLDVRDNFLHPNSALALSLLLSKAKQLKGLNISDCNLTTKSNEAILSALEVY